MPGGVKMQRASNSAWFSCGLAVSTRFACQGCGREAARCELVLFWLDSCRGPESSGSGSRELRASPRKPGARLTS